MQAGRRNTHNAIRTMITMTYQSRTYRSYTESDDLTSFKVAVSQTDLFISADSSLKKEAKESIARLRSSIEEYISVYPNFADTLMPVAYDKNAPPIVKSMIRAAESCNTGPMAGVAGAIAEGVGKDLLLSSTQVIIENGGDIFIASKVPRVVGLYAGKSKFSKKVGISIEPKDTPCGICTSSATVGHSLSFGRADAVVVLSPSAPLADCCATALCNRVADRDDIKSVINYGKKIKGIKGILVVIGDALGAWGSVKLVDI